MRAIQGVAGLRAQQIGAPGGLSPDYLQEVLDAGDLAGLLDQIEQAGLMPSAEELFDGVLQGWASLLRPGCGPLDAELSAAEFLGMLRQMAGAADLGEIVASLIEDAMERRTPEAMAMVSALAAVGPGDVRSAASGAAARLAAAALTVPTWAAGLGRPSVGECFGYGDDFGEQETLGLCFSYGRERHVVGVLIDHVLGGGVKDCFISTRPDQVRARFRKAARQAGLAFEDYTPAHAASILARALAREPCPEQPDQVEDVGSYLDLLRSRLTLLSAADAAGAAGATDTGSSAVPLVGYRHGKDQQARPTLHRVKITLRGAKPPIWRRLEVPSDLKLSRLHECVQLAFGWDGGHLWVFSTPGGEFGHADPGLGHRNASVQSLRDVAPAVGDCIRYTYDFGDDWEHEIAVEDIVPAEAGVAYPRCIGGRRACPPEDCGGIWGYQALREILADPSHPEHAERLEWLGLGSAAEFDPAAFDLSEANRVLNGLARVLVKT